MKKIILAFSFLALSFGGFSAYTSDDHDDHKHSEKETEHKDHEEGHKHSENEVHGEHKEDEHGHAHGGEGHDDHEEEGGGTVGPEKGITEKAEAGFKLSPEALKTMGIQSKGFSGGTIQVPLKAIVSIKSEKTIFRIRNGWYKRVKFDTSRKDANAFLISSKNFREGDQIVTEGSGFLRIAEIYAEEGASHSHAH